MSLRKQLPISEKAQILRDAIALVAPERVRTWTRDLHTDEVAFEIIDGCIEGDFDPRTEWDQALTQFKHYFKSYADNCAEERADYNREFGNELEP